MKNVTAASLRTRVRDLHWRELLLLAHAFCALAAARIALRVVAVERILAWQGLPVATRAPSPGTRHAVRWAVLAVARRSPLQFVCFPQCLAASYLLRRCGISSRLHYGVSRVDAKLVTHTWLESGGEVLIGGEVKDGYSTLGVY